jgi:hypothetical protein
MSGIDWGSLVTAFVAIGGLGGLAALMNGRCKELGDVIAGQAGYVRELEARLDKLEAGRAEDQKVIAELRERVNAQAIRIAELETENCRLQAARKRVGKVVPSGA